MDVKWPSFGIWNWNGIVQARYVQYSTDDRTSDLTELRIEKKKVKLL
jgi:hypothetical protein